MLDSFADESGVEIDGLLMFPVTIQVLQIRLGCGGHPQNAIGHETLILGRFVDQLRGRFRQSGFRVDLTFWADQ